jgi:cellulose synthase (UDP-forming)
MNLSDRRLDPPGWDAGRRPDRALVRAAVLVNLVLATWYLGWLLQPERVGSPILYGGLVLAELFNLAQGVAFWWTVWADRPCSPAPRWRGQLPAVDVFVPVCREPVDVVEPTVAAASRLRGADVRVHVLDDGDDPAIAEVAARHGAQYVVRTGREGAKAGNVNHALRTTSAPFVAVFDCDHVPDERFLEATLGHFQDARMALVQTPQHYANALDSPVAAAAAAQQRLFFGAICRGKSGRNAVFCCGTNVVFRRTALDAVGGFPEDSVTEDFALSVRLHGHGWRTEYVAEVLASGLGPEDMASYVGQQRRWARGCLGSIPLVVRTKLPWRQRFQYLSSALYFLSGWTMAAYMAMPVLRLLGGIQPVAATDADAFLTHFAPYFLASLGTVAIASGGEYTFSAFALSAASFGVHLRSTLLTLLGRRARFVVTPKHGGSGRQLRPIGAALVSGGALLLAITWGLSTDPSPSTINNVAYAGIHVAVLAAGTWPALVGVRQPTRALELEQAGAVA